MQLPRPPSNLVRRVATVLALAIVPLLAVAQEGGGTEDPETLVNYAYAVGDTAFFNVVGQSVQAVRLPISYTLRSLDDHPWGVKLRFPISFGLHEFSADDISNGELRERLATVSGLAGAEFLIPVGERWTLKPFIELGAGKDLDGGAVAYIYSAGLSTVALIKREQALFRVGAELDYDGAQLAGGGPSHGFTTLEAGLDVRFPIERGGRWADWSVYGIRTRFLSPLTFEQIDGEKVELRNQNEAGFTLGIDPPIGWWLLKVGRIGLGYRFGEKLSSVRVLFGVPF